MKPALLIVVLALAVLVGGASAQTGPTITVTPSQSAGTIPADFFGGAVIANSWGDSTDTGYLDLIASIPYEVLRLSADNGQRGYPPAMNPAQHAMTVMFDGIRARRPGANVKLYTAGPFGSLHNWQSDTTAAAWVTHFLNRYGPTVYKKHELYNEPAATTSMIGTSGRAAATFAYLNGTRYYNKIKAAYPALEIDAFVYATGQSDKGFLQIELNEIFTRCAFPCGFDNLNLHSYGHNTSGQTLLKRMYDTRTYLATDPSRTGLWPALRYARERLNAAGYSSKGLTLGEHMHSNTLPNVASARFDVAGAIVATRAIPLGLRHLNLFSLHASRVTGKTHADGIVTWTGSNNHAITDRGIVQRDQIGPFLTTCKRLVAVTDNDPDIEAAAAKLNGSETRTCLLVQNTNTAVGKTVAVAGVPGGSMTLPAGGSVFTIRG